MKILLIAGHGGTPYDPGACGNGYKEAVETRRITTALAPMLRKYGFYVSMYDQNNDAYKILKSGGSLPLSGVGYVIEVHLNAGVNDKGNGNTTGVEVLVHTNESGVTVEEAICKRISALGFKNRGVKRRGDLLVMNTVHRNGISHALIETCFVDDADDMKLYKAKFNDIVKAIADGVAEGFGKEVEEDMTAQEVKKIVNQELASYAPVYTTIADVPDWGKETVEKLVSKGWLKGEGDGNLNLPEEMLRVLVINDRAGIYG